MYWHRFFRDFCFPMRECLDPAFLVIADGAPESRGDAATGFQAMDAATQGPDAAMAG